MDADGAVAELGGLEVTRDNFLAGLKEVEPSATREFFIEKSTTKFANLGGLSDVKRLLDAVIEHTHVHDEIYEQVGLSAPARNSAGRAIRHREDRHGARIGG